MIDQIPQELKELNQWVCSGPDKLPLNPRTGQAASVTNKSTWGTFGEAVAAGYQNVGFVLTEEDKYAIIDLDDPEKMRSKGGQEAVDKAHALNENILSKFDAYSERSQSGKGYHIIVEGSVPAGIHRDTVEVYSTARYMICTGNAVKQMPITNQQPLLDIIYEEMKPMITVNLQELESSMDDEQVVDMAMSASNGDKFNQLCAGDWENDYSSQSEADLALLSIIAYYTVSDEQVRRIFRMSKLGKRTKAIKNDTYINYALSKVRAQQPAQVDFAALMERTAEVLKPAPAPKEKKVEKVEEVLYPPGLVGELAQYIYSSAIRPVPEVGLTAAIALAAGVCGRSYNISSIGLNQYIILVAKTGSGKEGAARGIDAIVTATRKTVPMVDEFIGPSAFASGQALIKVLDNTPCFVSVLGEFGLTLQQLCDPRANAPTVMLKRVFLDLYGKSGWTNTLRSSVYSDQEKNTKVVQAPAVTLYGETTPSTFYDGLDQATVAEGLIPRFTIVEYTGPRPPRNPNAFFPPSEALIKRFADLVTVALTTRQNNTCSPVQTCKEASDIFDAFDTVADDKINACGQEAETQLYNRAHLKALKLAALVAVGCNPHQPIISKEVAEWAVTFVKKDVSTILDKFSEGEVGVGDHRQESDVRKAVEVCLQMTTADKNKHKIPKAIASEDLVPYSYLRRRLRLRAAFKNDRKGATLSLQLCLDDMVKAGILGQLSPQQLRNKFKLESPVYYIGESW